MVVRTCMSVLLCKCLTHTTQRRIGVPDDDSDSSGEGEQEMELSDSDSDEEGGRARRPRYNDY